LSLGFSLDTPKSLTATLGAALEDMATPASRTIPRTAALVRIRHSSDGQLLAGIVAQPRAAEKLAAR
jgi:hypothetical protein